MLFHTIDEIQAIYPTSRWTKFDKLAPMLAKVERIKLSKILGFPLLQKLNEQYDIIIESAGTLHHTDPEEVKDVPALAYDLIRSCHEFILFSAISNNVRMLSMSFNSGGGFNRMEGADYNAADDKEIEGLKREMWMNALDSLESILLILEQDARDGQNYTSLWKSSPYYYEQGDLLITTAVELNRYVNIDSSREKYISMVAVLRQCQDTYLVARLGMPLVRALVARKYEKAEESNTTHQSPTPLGEGQGEGGLWRELRSYASAALANYAANEVKSLKTDRSIQNGDEQISLAIQLVLRNAEQFELFIPGTPLDYEFERIHGMDYETWKKKKEEEVTNPSVQCGCPPPPCSHKRRYDRNDYSNAIADFGGLLHSK